jgi:hypothetical protein
MFTINQLSNGWHITQGGIVLFSGVGEITAALAVADLFDLEKDMSDDYTPIKLEDYNPIIESGGGAIDDHNPVVGGSDDDGSKPPPKPK